MDNEKERLFNIEKRIEKIADNLDKAGFYDYIAYVNNKKHMYRRSFINGLLRGTGSAVGVTLCAAVIIVILRSLAESSIPYIAEFISRIMDIIDNGR